MYIYKKLALWPSELQNIFEKFVKPSGPPSYILNARSLKVLDKSYYSKRDILATLVEAVFKLIKVQRKTVT